MKKSILHLKSEHPSLLISLFLLAGIYLGSYSYLSKSTLFLWLLLSWLMMILMHQMAFTSFWKSILAKACLILWGYCITQIQSNTSSSIITITDVYIQPIRNFIVEKIDLFIQDNSNNHFAKALLIGQKNRINPELMEAYTSLGIVHIIAISGMHLELITQYLTKFANWLPKKKWLQIIILICLISLVIIYTLIANASPSIVRAAVFFCLFQIGTYFNLHKYLINSIASGLLIVLLFDHQTIHHIGWQLSYAAVIGIHLVHPMIQSTIELKNPAIQSVWNNFSITLSTQITTTPLLLFYFNKLSTGVILSNMIMIPLSNLLLQGLILLVILPNYWNKTLHWGQIIEYYMQKMTQIVDYIFTISPQPIQLASIQIKYLLVYYAIFLYLCLWKKRYNQPLFRFSTKMA
jgi:competence protein ComEC